MRTQRVQAPPERHGHESADGRWWWDVERGQWFRTTDVGDTLEVELEDAGHTTLLGSIATTLGGQSGVQHQRFVGHARSADPRWPTWTVSSASFPVLPLALVRGHEAPEDGGWPEEVRDALRGLEETLAAQGWRRAGTGAHWWSQVWTRPGIDWGTPPDAHDREVGTA